MANRLGFSLGEALRDAEAIKAARMENTINRLKLDEYKADKEAQAQLAPIRMGAAQGDSAATARLMALDPENAPKFIEMVNSAKKSQREEMAARVDEYGGQSAAILETLGRDPDQAMSAYKEWYKGASPEFRATMPTTNIKPWLEHSVAKATAMDDLLAEYKTARFGQEDLLIKGSQIKDRATRPLTPAQLKAMEGKGAGGIKDAEIKTIASIINRTMGGDFILGPDGELKFVGLTDEQSRSATAALTRAVELRAERGEGSQASAAMDAMKEFGLSFPEPSSRAPAAAAKSNLYERKPTSKFQLDPVTGQYKQLP